MSLPTPSYNLQVICRDIFLLWGVIISSFLTMRADSGNRSHSINMCWMNKYIRNEQVNIEDKGDRCYRQESSFLHPFIHQIFIEYLLLPGIVRGAVVHLGDRDHYYYIYFKNNFCLWTCIINIACLPCASTALEPEDVAVKRHQSSSFSDFTFYWV